MNIIQPVVLAIIKKDNKYLFTLRAEPNGEDSDFHGFWQIPGGGLEFGEDVETCLFREIEEELGITEVEIVALLPKMYHSVRDNWHGLFIAYLCKLTKDDVEIKINEEASEYGWFTFEEIKNLKTLPLTVEVMEWAEKVLLI